MTSAVEAMRLGAYDYLSKPVDLERLMQTLRRASERRQLVLENRDLLRRTQVVNRIKESRDGGVPIYVGNQTRV